MTTQFRGHRQHRVIAFLLLLAATTLAESAVPKKSKANPDQLRLDYIARLQQRDVPTLSGGTVGSLWTSSSTLGDLSTDYKARKLNDTIVILVGVQTTAAQSGNSSYQRTVATSSAITGLAGGVSTANLNPLFNANSATALK